MFRAFTPSALRSPKETFELRPFLVELLKEAGVDPAPWDGQQMPFRRGFATLFTRRYDLVEYPALQQQLAHLNMETTMPYQADKVQRPRGTSVEELHGRMVVSGEENAMILALIESQNDYLTDGVRRLLEGTFVGGKFSALVLALVKRLSADLDFVQLSLDRKAQVISTKLIGRKFQAKAMSHVLCMAGGASHTKTGANCFANGSLQRHEATPQRCSGCVNGWNNDSYLKPLRDDLARCEERLQDVNLDASSREEFHNAATQLKVLIEAEQNLAEKNILTLKGVSESWKQMIAKARLK